MIGYLKGRIEDIMLLNNSVAQLVIETNNIGFEVLCPAKLYNHFSGIKNETIVYTQLIMRETDQVIYGFDTKTDKEMFNNLLSLSGIGPKIALAVLNSYDAKTFIEIIIDENMNALSKISGIGKKNASRLVLELKPKFEQKYADGIDLTDTKNDKLFTAYDEVYSALKGIGYSNDEIKSSLSRAYADNVNDVTEELVTYCLKSLAN